MSVTVLCVGKLKEKPLRQMADEYLKRLGRYGKYEESEIPDLPEPAGGTSAALEEMLREYLLAAQEGNTDQELLDELTDTLEEMHRCAQAGKLLVPGQRELSEIRRSIAEYTAAMTGNPSVQSFRSKESPEADEFRLIRELLVQQKEWLTEK